MKNRPSSAFPLNVINATFKTVMASSAQTLFPYSCPTNKENVMGKRNKLS